MIAFVSVFLMKFATKWNNVGFNVDSAFVWNVIDQVIRLLKTTIPRKRPLLYYIACGLEMMRVKLLEQKSPYLEGRDTRNSTKQISARTSQYQIHYGLPYPENERTSDSIRKPQLSSNGFTNTQNGTEANDETNTNEEFNHIMCMCMSDELIFEAFGGNECSYDVYTLPSSQFTS